MTLKVIRQPPAIKLSVIKLSVIKLSVITGAVITGAVNTGAVNMHPWLQVCPVRLMT